MKRKFETLIQESLRAAEFIEHAKHVRVVSHYDADGITSAAIVVKALEREGKPFHLTIVKQLSEQLVGELSSERGDLILFTDTGAGFLSEIQEALPGRVVILDHHQTQGEISEDNQGRIVHVNPVTFGIEEDISGSGVTYLCMRALNPENRDLSEFAIIGAIGDSQTGSIGPHWGLLGLNKEILKDAEITRKIKVTKGLRLWGRYTRPVHKALQFSVDPYIPEVSGSETGAIHFLQETGIELKRPDGSWRTLAGLSDDEMRKLSSGIIKERIRSGSDNPDWIFGDVYELIDKDEEFRDANEFATVLNGCGKMEQSYVGIAICLNNKEYYPDVRKILESYRREVGRGVDWIRSNPKAIRATDHADYILAGNRISEHIISNVVSIINKSCLLPDDCRKPVFAFADTEDGRVKVSARMDDSLAERGLNLKEVLETVTRTTGGEGGGHIAAGGATIPKEGLETFIRMSQELIRESMKKHEASPERTRLMESLMDDIEDKSEAGTQNNLNSTEHKIQENGDGYGIRESKGPREEREGADREVKEEKGRKEQGEVQRPVSKEMEGKGLVRYLGS
jgi:single-stranded-DNA-specific exonuclease